MAAITTQEAKTPPRRRFGGARTGGGRTARGGGMNWRIRLRRDKSLVLMTVPALILLLLFNYLPMAGIIVAFEHYDIYQGIVNSDFVGLGEFRELLANPDFWHAFENTLVISFVQLILYFPVPIALALLVNTILSTRARAFIQAVVYLPHFFSFVLVITIFQEFLGGAGVLNVFLNRHGISSWDVMTNPHTFKYLVTAQAVWKEAGWGLIVFLAALAAIDPALYESAAVDGAGRWRRMRHITLPGLRGIVVLMLVLRLGNALSVGFEQMLIQRQAVGAGAADVLDTYSYIYGIGGGFGSAATFGADYSYGAAAGLFKAVLSLILILGANKLAHAFGEDGLYRK
ncbi:ABC transporter permease subunit [Catenulispora subtropica]|uniref:ABC transporter permease subunit n=2 Tax=Catenulispora subtropica TaxID=450798 RepID=A0ABN2RFY3_9ACTN